MTSTEKESTTESKPAFDSVAFLKNVTRKPGVYRMIDDKEQVIYVGKAKNLKKPLKQLFSPNRSVTKNTGDGV